MGMKVKDKTVLKPVFKVEMRNIRRFPPSNKSGVSAYKFDIYYKNKKVSGFRYQLKKVSGISL